MRHEVLAESAAGLLTSLRRELRADIAEVARVTWHDRALLSRIESGREARLPTLRRIVAALGGRLELAARFERPLEALASDLQDERDRRRERNDRVRHERTMRRWAEKARRRAEDAGLQANR